jgi:primosomal protein N' (replication factor Y)
VYFEAVAAALKLNKQVLILLPEIALSNAFLDRFEKRFGCAPALWHSAITPAMRRKTWRGVATAQTKVVIGARSALFLPFKELGAIIVDEEHDPAFKQEEGVIYHARDMAVMRCFLQSCPIALISATPSLETVQNIMDKRYEHLVLPSRFGKAILPQMHIVNMKEEKIPRSEFISPTLREALLQTHQRGEQSLLFLNRRGYAPLTLCRSCGHRYECPQCSSWLVLHGNMQNGKSVSGRLQCHHCGFSTVLTQKCTSCGAEDSQVPCGPGVERIEEEVKSIFPQIRSMVLASDTNGDGEDFFTSLAKVREGAVDLVIGTQIMAKGHHFPNLTCVGVIDADLGLKGGDLRAGEHTWQLLHQVAGRAGRGELEGHVYIQTYSPESNFMQALLSGDRDRFQAMELGDRRLADMPPYWRLSSLIISSENEEELGNYVREMAKVAPQASQDDVRYYGPAPAPLYMLRGRYRGRFLIQSRKSVDIQSLIQEWLGNVKASKSSKLRVQVDIDPHSFF